MLFCHKKEWNSDKCYNTDFENSMYAKWHKLVTQRQTLYDFTHIKYLEYANL